MSMRRLDPLMSSEKQDWTTPKEFFDIVNMEFSFTVDAAASLDNTMLPRFWDRRRNGLRQDWTHERIWCNPPYGKEQKPFIAKAAECKAEVSVLLIPARTDTAVWHEWIFPLAEIRFLRGRITFQGAQDTAPFPSALVIFRKEVVPITRSMLSYNEHRKTS